MEDFLPEMSMEELRQIEDSRQIERNIQLSQAVEQLHSQISSLSLEQASQEQVNQLNLLANATDSELECLARNTTRMEVVIPNEKITDRVKLGDPYAEESNPRFHNEDLYQMVYIYLGKLRAKALEILGRELPKEKLN